MIAWHIFALLSAFFVALGLILRKKVLLKEHVAEFLGAFYLISLLIILPFYQKATFSYPLKWYIIILITSLIGSISLLLLCKSYRHLEISEVAPLTNLSPIILIFIAFLFLRELPSLWQLSGILLIILGAYSLEIDYKHKNFLRPFKIFENKYYIYILLAMLGYSITATLDKFILNNIDYFSYYFITRFFFLAIFFSYHSVVYDGYKGIKKGIVNHGWLIFIIAIIALISSLFYLKALSLTMVSLVIPIKRLSTLIAVVIGGTLFHEHGLVQRILACVLMIGGAALIIL